MDITITLHFTKGYIAHPFGQLAKSSLTSRKAVE
jgi:hypothetical protein